VSSLKQPSKDAIVYGIGGAAGKRIFFFPLPVYVLIFAPADYANQP